MKKQFTRRIQEWWRGEFAPYDNDPNADVFFIGGSFKRHSTSRTLRRIVGFLAAEWKWVFSAVKAIIGLIIAYQKL